MNLSDLLDNPQDITQNNWSAQSPVYGEYGQIVVIGLDGKKIAGNKTYIVKCNICSLDPEMFGEGFFRTTKSSLVGGSVPCSCAKKAYRWSSQQWFLRLKRRANEFGFSIISPTQTENINHATRVVLSCKKHGEWATTTNYFLNSESNCHGCAEESCRDNNRKPDEEMIASFFASGAFHPETKFWRSDRKVNGLRKYWKFLCPICCSESESQASSLQAGFRGCDCGRSKQTKAYINLVLKNNGVCAVKFGIACNVYRRVARQNNMSPLDVVTCMVYDFPDYMSCRAAETACKRTLKCNFLEKQLMPDGYTETTELKNLNTITEIYESFGGVLKNEAFP